MAKFRLIVTCFDGKSTTCGLESIHTAKSVAGSLFKNLPSIRSVFVQSTTTQKVWLYKVKDLDGNEIVEKTIAISSPHPTKSKSAA